MNELPYHTKLTVAQRLLGLILLEPILNQFLYSWKLSLRIIPLVLFLFLRRHCSFVIGLITLFFVTNLYEPALHSEILSFFVTAVAFYCGNLFDFDKAALLVFWGTQYFLNICLNHDFVPSILIANGLFHVLMILCVNLDILPKKNRKRESIFV